VATETERNRGAGAFSTPGVDQPFTPPASQDAASSPLVGFKFRNIDPNAVTYVTSDDTIALRVVSNFVPQTVTFGISVIRAIDGELTKEIETVIATVAGAVTALNIRGVEGFLVGVAASAGTSVQRGDTYAKAILFRGSPGSQAKRFVLFEDYVSGQYSASWPGSTISAPSQGSGKLRSITGTVPGAGAEISETVPTATRWRLKSLSATFAASATVANRFPTFVLDDGVNTFFAGVDTQAITAGQTWRVTFAPGITFLADATNLRLQEAGPGDAPLFVGYRIRSSTFGIQVGDQWSAPQCEVEELIDNI